MKRLILVVLVLSAVFVHSQEKKLKYHAFSGTLMIGVEGGMTLGFTDYSDVRPQVLGRGVLEYFFPTTSAGIFGIKAFALGGYVSGKDADIDPNLGPSVFRSAVTRFGGGISYTFSVGEKVFPYVFAGVSYGWINPKDENNNELPYTSNTGVYDAAEENYHAEAGLKFLLSDAINLNLNIGTEFSPRDYWDNYVAKGNNDFMMYLTIGMGYSLFTKVDEDHDGVPDTEDQCPGTPASVKVDEFGCPLDSDNDGVPDYKDKCANTKPGMKVDSSGCVTDNDNDGVPDNIDKCPNTPEGAKVNEFGCADSDQDGVFDNDDKCPNTPQNAPVDEQGCPKDSDNDGVPDYKDECSNTPAGKQVDGKGCVKEVEVRKIILRGDANFEFNKSSLLSSAYTELDSLAASIKRQDGSRWRIEGHTDAVGSDSYNMELSRRRAQAVADYLASKGVERDRLEIIPLGETRPVAANDTAEGRAMNRRVEINIIGE